MKKRFLYYLLVLLVNFGISFAHGEEVENSTSSLNPWIIVPSLVIGLLASIYVFKRYYEKKNKKYVLFCLIVLVVVAITSYLAINTTYNNLTSFSRGPIHWHADFQIWICGNLIELEDPKNIFTNKIGSAEAHEHNDNRIHLEGLMKQREDALLGNFFESIGGSLSSNSISIPVNEQGSKTWINGDLCNNKEAKLYMFVNSELNNEFDSYLIKPYADVPPGDEIKFVFTEKSLDEINKELGAAP